MDERHESEMSNETDEADETDGTAAVDSVGGEPGGAADGGEPARERRDAEILPLTHQTIGLLDSGRIGLEINRQIVKVVQDINERPCNVAGETEKRKVKVDVILEPRVEEDEALGKFVLTGINVECEVSGIVPKVKSARTDVRIVGNRILFNRDVPRDFTQRVLEYD